MTKILYTSAVLWHNLFKTKKDKKFNILEENLMNLMKKILFVNPPYAIKGDKAIIPQKAMLPVGPLSIAGGLRKLGNKVNFLDLVFCKNWLKELGKINFSSFDQILISCHTARNILSARKIVDFIRASEFDKNITLGGNLPVDLGIDDFAMLGIEVSSVVRGYGHGCLEQILDETTGDIFPTYVPEKLPLPALDLLDKATHKKYFKYSYGQYPIIGSGGFGCQYRCSDCSAHMGCRFTPRNISNSLEEAEQAHKYGYNKLWCVDNNLLQSPKFVLEFGRGIAPLGLEWTGMSRAEHVSDFNLLVELNLGLREIAIGIESINPEKYGRKKDLALIQKSFSLLRQADIKSIAFVILDGPQETEKSFWELYYWLNPDSVSWSFYNPPPRVGLLEIGLKPEQYGFYNWPFGISDQPQTRVVQQAMILSGVWWCGWELNEKNPFWETEMEFGVSFQNKRIFQNKNARSPIGDIWQVWQEEDI